MGKKKSRAKAVESAPFGRRIAAFLIDWYVGALATALPVATVALCLGREVTDQNILGYEAPWGAVAGLLGVTCGLVYYAVVPMLLDGRTLGKALMHLRIRSRGGGRADAGQLVLRQAVGLVLVEQAAVGTSFVVQQLVSMAAGPVATTGVMWAGMALTLASFVCVGVRRDHRALHDLLSDTRVVLG